MFPFFSLTPPSSTVSTVGSAVVTFHSSPKSFRTLMHSFEFEQTRNATSRRLCFEKCQLWVFTSRCVSYAITLSGQTVIQRWYSVKHNRLFSDFFQKLNGVAIVIWIELLHFICQGTNFTMNFTMFVGKKCYLCMGFQSFLS